MQPILHGEVAIAVASLKLGKSAGVDNIPAEPFQTCERPVRVTGSGEWPTPWTRFLIITLPKKGKLQVCKNNRTISLICHSTKSC